MTDDPYRSAPLVASNAEDGHAQVTLSRELAGDEELLWAGRPAQGLMFRSSDVIQVPFMMLWTAFACYWEYSALHTNAPLIMKFWGLPFVGIGLHMLVGRFFLDARTRSRTYYGLTKRRALLLVEGSTRKLVAVDLDRRDEISIEERADGTGSIVFGKPVTIGNSQRTVRPTAFERIPDVRKVFAMVRDAQATSESRR